MKECGFKSWEEARNMLGCEEVEKVIWNIIMSSFFKELTCPTTPTRKGKWLGIFPNEEDPNPYVVFATT